MKVKVTIVTTHTATFDAGDIPTGLLLDVLRNNDGTFDGNWALQDIVLSEEKYEVDVVSVAEVK